MKSHRLSVRVMFLQQYLSFLDYIETEIRYSKKLIYEIIKSYTSQNELSYFLRCICNNIQNNLSFNIAWKDAVYKLPDYYGLQPQDKEFISDFGRQLGTTDTQGQVSLCQLNKAFVTSALEIAKNEKSKKSKLYFILGSSFGLCLTVVFL